MKNQNYLYLPITKTACMSVSNALGKFNIRNTNHCYIKNLDYKNNIIITNIRNPYTRVFSQYCFYQNKRSVIPKDMTFTEFCVGYPKWKNSLNSENTFDTCFNILSIEGELIVNMDYVIKFESIKDDFIRVCSLLEIECELPHQNKNNLKYDILGSYNQDCIDSINNHFHLDFKHFNYKKIQYYENFINSTI